MITNSTFILVTSILAVVAIILIVYFTSKMTKKSKSRKEELEKLRNTSAFSSDIIAKYGRDSSFAIEQEMKGNGKASPIKASPIDKNNKINLQQDTTNSVTYIEPFSKSQITQDIIEDSTKYKQPVATHNNNEKKFNENDKTENVKSHKVIDDSSHSSSHNHSSNHDSSYGSSHSSSYDSSYSDSSSSFFD